MKKAFSVNNLHIATSSQESLLQARLIADAIMQKLAVENLTFTRGNKQVTASLQLC